MNFMNHIVEGLGVINAAPSGGFTKVTIIKVVKFLCREGNQNKENVAMATPNRNVHGNSTFLNG
jgi:hypothetical protein